MVGATKTDVSGLEKTEQNHITSHLYHEGGDAVRGTGIEHGSFYVQGGRKYSHRGVANDLPDWATATGSSDAGRTDLRVYVEIDMDAWREYDQRRTAIREAVLDVTGTGYMGTIRDEIRVRTDLVGRYRVTGPFAREVEKADLEAAAPDGWSLAKCDVSGKYGTATYDPPD